MRGKGRKDSPGDAAVSVCVSCAKNRIGLVNDHDHRSEGPYRHEDAHLLALCVADPLGTKLTHFHDWQAALAGETIDEKRLPRAVAGARRSNGTTDVAQT